MTEKTQVYAAIGQLVRYGLHCGLLPEEEAVYARNLLLGELQLDDYTETPAEDGLPLDAILKPMLDYAVENGLTRGDSATARDLFDTRLMNCLTPALLRFSAYSAKNTSFPPKTPPIIFTSFAATATISAVTGSNAI